MIYTHMYVQIYVCMHIYEILNTPLAKILHHQKLQATRQKIGHTQLAPCCQCITRSSHQDVSDTAWEIHLKKNCSYIWKSTLSGHFYICWLNGTFTTDTRKTLTSVKQLPAHSTPRQEGEELGRKRPLISSELCVHGMEWGFSAQLEVAAARLQGSEAARAGESWEPRTRSRTAALPPEVTSR